MNENTEVLKLEQVTEVTLKTALEKNSKELKLELTEKIKNEIKNDFAFAAHSFSEMRQENRFVLKILGSVAVVLLISVGAFAWWTIEAYKNPHIAKISYTGTKTLIELKNHGKVIANSDDKTGVITIEVSNAKE